jgi:putative membrane protein
MQDLILAIVHHVVVFAIFGILFGEFVLLNGVLNNASITRLAKLDLWYGILAGIIIVLGMVRAIYAAKGWAYYSHNAFFWAKLGTFALIGILSISPTLTFMRWRKAGTAPDAAALRPVRRMLHIELTLLILAPVFAAAMARGYGQF